MKKTTGSALLLASFLIFASGCGNALHGSKADQSQASFDSTTLASTSPYVAPVTSDPNYTCGNSQNVLPDYDYNVNGTGRFTVCPSNTNTTDVEIVGTPYKPGGICAFPAQRTSNSEVFWKPDATGLPLMMCTTFTALGAYTSFPNTNYNILFVVDAADASSMQRCLIAGNYGACPMFSWGQFR